jgi:hypothetical protein
VVGAPAWAAFRDACGLRERLAEGLTGLDVDDRGALVAASDAARAAV